MTAPRPNRLLTTPSSSAHIATGAPSNLDDYVIWMNAKEKRRGRWVIATDEQGARSLAWREENASDEWLTERKIVPSIGKAA